MPIERIICQNANTNNNNEPFDKLEDEKVHFTLPKVVLHFNKEKEEGTGTLFVTTRRVVWIDETLSGFGFDFHEIMCHALSKESGTIAQKPCIYAQLDNDDDETCEARFIPEDPANVEAVYTAFSECAAMNPDPIEEDEDEFYTAENIHTANFSTEQLSRLERLESMLTFPDQFEDAAEDEEMVENDDEDQQNVKKQKTDENE